MRNSVVTIHFTGEAYDALPQWGDFDYIKRASGQLECGEKTHKLHWQCFLEFKYPMKLEKLKSDHPGIYFKKLTEEEILAITGGKKMLHPIAGRRYVTKEKTCVDKKFRFDWPTNPGNGAWFIERRKLTDEADKIARTIVWDPESDIRAQKLSFIKLLSAQIKVCNHILKV